MGIKVTAVIFVIVFKINFQTMDEMCVLLTRTKYPIKLCARFCSLRDAAILFSLCIRRLYLCDVRVYFLIAICCYMSESLTHYSIFYIRQY